MKEKNDASREGLCCFLPKTAVSLCAHTKMGTSSIPARLRVNVFLFMILYSFRKNWPIEECRWCKAPSPFCASFTSFHSCLFSSCRCSSLHLHSNPRRHRNSSRKKKTHAWITSDRSAVRFEWPIGKSRGRSEKKINIFLSFIYLFQWGQQVWRWQNLKGKKRNAFFLFWNSPISAYHFLNISSFLFCRFHCIDIIYTRHRLILLSV